MNTNTNNNAQAQELAAAVTALTQVIEEAIKLAKEEEAVTSTTTEATATTEAASTAPIIVLDDDDSVIGFTGSMIEQEPMDPMPTYEETADTAETKESTDEETVTADEANAVADTEKMLDDIIADISALYNISSYALSNEGKNIDSDRSPYSPKENKVGVIGDYQVFISKEITKDGDHIEGSFRLIIKDRSIVSPIMDHSLTIVNGHIKVYSSDNTLRLEKMKESNALMRFLEIVEEMSALVMSKYISD